MTPGLVEASLVCRIFSVTTARDLEEDNLKIIYQDEHLVAVDKPAGLLVHRSSLDAGESRFCLQMLREQLGQRVYPCHRLDKPTSGILLFALHPEALVACRKLFETGVVEKRYLAIVRGWVPAEGRIDSPLIPERDYSRKTEPQAAVTLYRCLYPFEIPLASGRYSTTRYSMVELKPLTGRTHQLRRHLAHLRHPIIGDTRHGDGLHNRIFRDHLGCHRLLLAAVGLKLPHPVTQRPLALHQPVTELFSEVIRWLFANKAD